MNTFAGSFTLKEAGEEIQNKDFDIISCGNGSYFCMGQIDVSSSTELRKYLESEFGEFKYYDLSISGEDEVEVFAEDYFSDGVYECVSFEGPQVDIDMISERFENVDEVVVVRTAEESGRHGNKIIKVDFLY